MVEYSNKFHSFSQPQDKYGKARNVLLLGPSGSGKSSIINYLAGKELAEVDKVGKSCTTQTKCYEVTLKDMKLNIIDSQGLFDTRQFLTSPAQLGK